MNVFIISQGQDTGGQAQRTAAAFRKLRPDWKVDAMVASETYIRFPLDQPWDDRVARRLYDEADVVHHMNWLIGYAMHERGQRKPAIVHHHGPPLRSHPDEVNAEAKSIGATQIVATVDLLEQAPHAEWVPGFYDLDWIRRTFPRRRSDPSRLRIGHGPTVRDAKGTDAILAAIDRVATRITKPRIELELTEGVDWHESLRRKAECDIWIDQITLGYGGSAIEAMAMGIPTISGWAEPRHMARFIDQAEYGLRMTFSTMPFMHASDGEGVAASLLWLVADADKRLSLGERGSGFVGVWHSDHRGVAQLSRIYTDAATRPTLGVDALELWNGPEIKRQAIAKWGKRR